MLIKNAPDECVSTVNCLGSGALLMILAYAFDPPQIDGWFIGESAVFWSLLATSLLNVIIMFGTVKALKYGDVSLIGPISATQPMVVLIPSWFILREWPGVYGYWGLLLLAVGMYLFAFGESVYVMNAKGEKVPWQRPSWLAWAGDYAKYFAPWAMLFRNRGIQIALLAAVCGAIAINFDKLTTLRVHSFLFPPACILLFCGAVGLLKTVSEHAWRLVNNGHIISLIINPILLTVSIILFWTSFQYGLAAYVGALKRTSVIFSLILGYYVLHEHGAKNRWVGAIIMAVGASTIGFD